VRKRRKYQGKFKRGEGEGENPPQSPFTKGDEIPGKGVFKRGEAPLFFSPPLLERRGGSRG
jgi:hypothetical protein